VLSSAALSAALQQAGYAMLAALQLTASRVTRRANLSSK